jgi:hypothetical protein
MVVFPLGKIPDHTISKVLLSLDRKARMELFSWMDSDQFASFAVLWNGIHMDLFRNAGQNYSSHIVQIYYRNIKNVCFMRRITLWAFKIEYNNRKSNKYIILRSTKTHLFSSWRAFQIKSFWRRWIFTNIFQSTPRPMQCRSVQLYESFLFKGEAH